MFIKKASSATENSDRINGFEYLGQNFVNMDAACQSMRPQPVMDALSEYYTKFNACGGRVQYEWGKIVDSKVEAVRSDVLKFLKMPARDYTVSFTLNTTYGLNLLLHQLPKKRFKCVVTSDIEHNSVFLSTISFANEQSVDRLVLEREVDGSLNYKIDDLKDAVVVLNAVSNIDGRTLVNINQIIKDAHSVGGIVIIDAAQAMAHSHKMLENCGADAICFSAHKMYSASLGVIVINNNLLRSLDISYIGGGMVSAVAETSYTLAPDNIEAHLEPGLQAFGEIIALGVAIDWLKKAEKNSRVDELSQKLFDGLKSIDGLTVINQKASPVISVYSDKLDAHLLAKSLSLAGIMSRSGYYCCHYYLLEKKKYPPLLRFSMGLHTSEADIDKVIETMKKIAKGF